MVYPLVYTYANLNVSSMKFTAPQTEAEVVITHEDVDRAHDRVRVSDARAHRGFSSKARLLWLLAGPGVLVMLGENDGPSMLTYAATGARFGIGFFLPFVVLTFCMAIVVQEMTVRLGAATHRGHAELIFERFGPFWGWFSMIDLGIGNFLTLITEFIAIRAGLGFFGVPPWAAVAFALVVLYAALMSHRYWTWERITLAAAAFNLIFIPVALPGIIAATIFAFTVSWAQFLYPLVFTTSTDQLVLPVGIITTLIKGDVFNWGQIMTGALLGAAPPLIIYAFLMDYYIAGLTAGATKG